MKARHQILIETKLLHNDLVIYFRQYKTSLVLQRTCILMLERERLTFTTFLIMCAST